MDEDDHSAGNDMDFLTDDDELVALARTRIGTSFLQPGQVASDRKSSSCNLSRNPEYEMEIAHLTEIYGLEFELGEILGSKGDLPRVDSSTSIEDVSLRWEARTSLTTFVWEGSYGAQRSPGASEFCARQVESTDRVCEGPMPNSDFLPGAAHGAIGQSAPTFGCTVAPSPKFPQRCFHETLTRSSFVDDRDLCSGSSDVHPHDASGWVITNMAPNAESVEPMISLAGHPGHSSP